jgi:hypothetical protein
MENGHVDIPVWDCLFPRKDFLTFCWDQAHSVQAEDALGELFGRTKSLHNWEANRELFVILETMNRKIASKLSTILLQLYSKVSNVSNHHCLKRRSYKLPTKIFSQASLCLKFLLAHWFSIPRRCSWMYTKYATAKYRSPCSLLLVLHCSGTSLSRFCHSEYWWSVISSSLRIRNSNVSIG